MKLNFDQSGFFRVLYPEKMLSSLKGAISSQALNPTDRLGLANDVLSLSQGNLSTKTPTLTKTHTLVCRRIYVS